jgi:uncharacterized protein YpmB
MPQAIAMQVIMQVIQQIAQKIMEMVSQAMQQGQSQEQMQQSTQQQMEQDGILQQQQQVDTYNEAGNTAMLQGLLDVATTCFNLGALRAEMAC